MKKVCSLLTTGCHDPTDGLENFEKTNICCPFRVRNLCTVQPFVLLLYRLFYRDYKHSE